jgi:uncharacterized membrane protein YdjX (TVP38/TMEM64 family)
MTSTTSYKNVWLSILVLLLLGALVLWSHTFSQQIIASLQSSDDAILEYIHTHFIESVLMFALVYITAATISLPIESALCIAAGYFFGTLIGTTVAVISATIGAFAIFLLIKYFLHDWFHSTITTGPVARIIRGLNKDAFSYLLFLRLVPLFPFFIINLALSFSSVRKRDYVLATFIGVIPGTFVFVLAGTQLATIRDTHRLVSPETFGILLLLALFSLGPILWRKKMETK